jgi:hypothetical protein
VEVFVSFSLSLSLSLSLWGVCISFFGRLCERKDLEKVQQPQLHISLCLPSPSPFSIQFSLGVLQISRFQ